MLDFATIYWLVGVAVPVVAYVKYRGKKLITLIREAFKDNHLSKKEFEEIVAEAGTMMRFLFGKYSEVDDVL